VTLVVEYRRLVAATLVGLLGLGSLVTASAASAAGEARRAPKGDAFYVPPDPLKEAKPGTIIRSTPIDAPAGAHAWRILYHSRAVDGSDIAVSGVVIAPVGKAPRVGRVVVAWAHGASGMADVCAPSKQADIASGGAFTLNDASFVSVIPELQTLLDEGYVVAATDYEGLGTPEVHPFLVGESEGRSVLDAARAAGRLKGAAGSSKVLVYGHSQGGQAALFAGELADSYAPKLQVLGIASAAPVAADTEQNFAVLASISAANSLVVMLVEAYHAAYPKFDPEALLTPEALSHASIFEQKCFTDAATTFPSSPNLALASDPLDIPALQEILHTNSAANRPTRAPVLVIQGSADADIPQVLTDAFVTKACAAGNTVDYRVYRGADHLGVIPAAADDIAAWFADRVSGAPASSTCP
jgi:pimeloyl-ACP methyl ester carboxylesterase